ncbi:MAG: HlyD family efflux transporter periplasmic adaptor subunit [Paracoccaceae bacterium]
MAQKKKRSRLYLTIGAVVVIGAGLAAAFWPRATMVDMGEVTRGPMIVTIDEEGRTRVRDAYVVSTPIAGRLQRVEVEPGDPVERGKTVVAHMLPTNPAALDVRTREQALAAVTAAEAALRVARADLNAALANRDGADAELARARQLAERGVTSGAALDRAQQTARVAAANVDTAEAAIAMRQAEVATARAQLIGFDDKGLGAAIDAAGVRQIPLYAPADGRILRIMQQSETTLPAGAPIMEIGNVGNDLEIVVELLSTDAVQVSPGDRVIIDDWGRPDTLDGKVERVDPFGISKFSALGVEEQRVNAVIRFTGPPEAHQGLGHGFRVETRIVVWEDPDTLIVPSSALFRSGGDWAVFRNTGGTAELRAIRLGRNNGTEAQVLDGLAEGDQVILFPSSGLTGGMSVAQRKVE